MLFPTFEYALFFALIFAITWAFGENNKGRKLFLIGVSWIFYGFWDYRFVLLLLVSSLLNWYIADKIWHEIEEKRKKNFLKIGIIINLSFLGCFKYFGFFTEQAVELLNHFGLARDVKLFEIILPVAISFFTFQGVSYVVDVYNKKCEPTKTPLDLILLTSFFPHLVAGPIVRAIDILPQFHTTPKPSREFFTWGALLIIWGLFKKTIIASKLAINYVDPIFFDIANQSSTNLIFGIWAYAVQIYCDFSAYSDIAVGSAALLGYRFCRNFDQPYRATSLQEFWRRWHISLSSWLRDYLYIPLGGSRGTKAHTNRNLIITMGLGGLWHGANWTFVIWGLIHGIALFIERTLNDLAPNGLKMPKILALFFTFNVVCIAWIFFRAPNFESAILYIKGFFWQDGETTLTPFVLFLIALGLVLNFIPSRMIENLAAQWSKLSAPILALFLAFLFIMTDALRDQGIAPFIYFQF